MMNNKTNQIKHLNFISLFILGLAQILFAVQPQADEYYLKSGDKAFCEPMLKRPQDIHYAEPLYTKDSPEMNDIRERCPAFFVHKSDGFPFSNDAREIRNLYKVDIDNDGQLDDVLLVRTAAYYYGGSRSYAEVTSDNISKVEINGCRSEDIYRNYDGLKIIEFDDQTMIEVAPPYETGSPAYRSIVLVQPNQPRLTSDNTKCLFYIKHKIKHKKPKEKSHD